MSDHCGRVVGHLLEHVEDLVFLRVGVRLHNLGEAVLQDVVGEGPQLSRWKTGKCNLISKICPNMHQSWERSFFFQPEFLVSGEDLEGPEAEPGGRQSEDHGGLLVLHPAVVETVTRYRVIRHLAGEIWLPGF